MNKTQKSALVGLVIALFLLLWIVIGATTVPPTETLRLLWVVSMFMIFGASIIFLRKKQSPAEPDFDERDILIKQKATTASYVSFWLMLVAAYTVVVTVLGIDTSIPLYLLAPALLLIFSMSGITYFIAILAQYGWGHKNGE
jgi:hypothetical protein